VNIKDIAQILRTASRMGAETDVPEGTRFIQLSETLVNQIARELESWIDSTAWSTSKEDTWQLTESTKELVLNHLRTKVASIIWTVAQSERSDILHKVADDVIAEVNLTNQLLGNEK